MNYQCNSCNKEITKPKDETRKFEWWKNFNLNHKALLEIEGIEKILLPKLVNKHPTEYNKVKTILAKVKDLYKELIKPSGDKIEEISWKFFYKKGKMFSPFKIGWSEHSNSEMCDSCYSELETQLRPHFPDEIESERISKKIEEKVGKEGNNIIEEAMSKLSEEERGEMSEAREKLGKEFFKNKEKELNNKILAEREREREREQIQRICLKIPRNLELLAVV